MDNTLISNMIITLDLKRIFVIHLKIHLFNPTKNKDSESVITKKPSKTSFDGFY